MKNLFLFLFIFLLISYTVTAQNTFTILHLNDTHSCLAPLGPRTQTLEGTQGGISHAVAVIGMTKMTEQNILTLHGDDSLSVIYSLIIFSVFLNLKFSTRWDCMQWLSVIMSLI